MGWKGRILITPSSQKEIMDTRQHDRKIIEEGLKSKDFSDRRQAAIARDRIRAESGETKKMREELVDAHRSGNRGKVEELHHKMHGKNKEIKKKVEKYYGGRRDYSGG